VSAGVNKEIEKMRHLCQAVSVYNIKTTTGCHAYLVQTEYTNMTAARNLYLPLIALTGEQFQLGI